MRLEELWALGIGLRMVCRVLGIGLQIVCGMPADWLVDSLWDIEDWIAGGPDVIRKM